MSSFPCWYFYTGDLQKDQAWRMCGWQARNLWLRMLMHLHEMPYRGQFMMPDGTTPLNDVQIVALLEMPMAEYAILAKELLSNGVAELYNGAIANRRMMREAQTHNNKSKAGKKGAEARWHNDGSLPYKDDNKSMAENAPYPIEAQSIPNRNQEDKKSARSQANGAVTDDQWIQGLKDDTLYTGINIDVQLKKALSWLKTNAPKRKFTRKFFGNWLVRAMDDKPMTLLKPKERLPL